MPTKAELEREMGELQAKLKQMEEDTKAKQKRSSRSATEKENLIAELQKRLDEATKDAGRPVDKDASDAPERPEGTKPSGGSERSTAVRTGSAKPGRSTMKRRKEHNPDP